MAGGTPQMRRNLSMEDVLGLAGSLTKHSSATFPRTDSEQAFQEFLKRIPSSNSLAAFGSHGSQLDLAAQGLQLSTIQQVASQAAAAGADGSGFNLGGVPRVNSLDFFRQLHVNLPVNQLNVAGSRPAAVAEGTEEGHDAAAASAGPTIAAAAIAAPVPVKAEIGSTGGAFQPPPAFAAGLPPIPAVLGGAALPQAGLAVAGLASTPTGGSGRGAAEALHHTASLRRTSSTTSGGGNTSSQRGGSGRLTSLRDTAGGPKDGGTKAELRRARRMLSNRESARRSRRRKQEHLSELETKIQALQDEKEEVQEELEAAQKELGAERAASATLRRQVEQLRAELAGRGGSSALVSTPSAPSPVGADTGSPQAGGLNGSAERASVDRKIPRVSSFPRVASAENLPSKKRLADGEAPPLVNGHRRKRTPQAADV